jgi:hypothetical protein
VDRGKKKTGKKPDEGATEDGLDYGIVIPYPWYKI